MTSDSNSADSGSRVRHLFDGWIPWLYTIALSLVLTLILSVSLLTPSAQGLQEGDIAQEEIVAPATRSYVSEVLTTRDRENAATAVSDVYSTMDRNVGRTQDGSARGMFDFITVVRADNSADLETKMDTLQAISVVDIDSDVARSLLTMRESDFNTVRNEVSRIIGRLMNTEIRDDGNYNTTLRVSREIGFGLTEAQEQAIFDLTTQFVVPNAFFNAGETEALRQAARDGIEPVTRSVSRGQTIVEVGQVISAEDVEKLEQIGVLQQEMNWWNIGSNAIVVFMAVSICMLYWRQYSLPSYHRRRYIVLISSLAIIFTVLARIMLSQQPIVQLLFPAVAMAMIVGVIFDVRFAVVVVLAMGGISGFAASQSLEVAFYVIVGSLMAVLSLRRIERINGIFRAGLIAGIGNLLVVLAFNLSPLLDLVEIGTLLALSVGNGVLAASLTVAGFYIIGSVFGIITTLQLQELSHLDHPLLKELLRRAPGTYHHSIMVSNLAEQAAERIRANAALVRVGAFYHDIGKMTRPPFFTENQEGVNPHDSLDPYSSARIIIAHVTDGLKLAQQYRLPQQVQDFIATHHGDRVLKGFYKKACAQAEDSEVVDIERFRYPGPRPDSRETGLVSMADTLEAASSAVQPNNPAAVVKLVNTLIDDMLQEGQLDNTGLSLGDIHLARESFIETMKGRFHIRVKYEGNEALQAENSPARAVSAELHPGNLEALPGSKAPSDTTSEVPIPSPQSQ